MAVPAAPSNLVAVAVSTTQVNLTWVDNSVGEGGFKIFQKISGSYVAIATLGPNVTSYSKTGLVAGTNYYFKVRSFIGTSNSAFSNIAACTTQGAAVNPPLDPSNLIATAFSANQINLAWTDNSSNETGFKIFSSTDGIKFVQIVGGIVGPGVTTFAHTGLTPSKLYYYRVKSYNAIGQSKQTNTASATTLAVNNPPVAPSNLVATANGQNRIDLSWVDNSTNETGFQVNRSTDGTNFASIFTTGAGATVYSDTGLQLGTRYWYQLRAVNAAGVSAPSNTADATTASAPTLQTPANFQGAALSSTLIHLTWEDVNNLGQLYQIERSLDQFSGFVYITGTGGLPTGQRSYDDAGLTPAKKYWYVMRCFVPQPLVISPFTPTISVTTLTPASYDYYVATVGPFGSGTAAAPLDGSTQTNFDAAMAGIAAGKSIKLVGWGPFYTAANKGWYVRNGWRIFGDGMTQTHIVLVGDIAGQPEVFALRSDPNVATNDVTIRDVLIDCNWDALTGVPINQAQPNTKTGAISIKGSNNLADHVRAANSYGNRINGREQFCIYFASPPNASGNNNIIQDCYVELPKGNMGAPFGLAGSETYPVTNSRVVRCTGIGNNSGTNDGFDTGGVNFSFAKWLTIDSNSFTDCLAAAYIDTGYCQFVDVTNNSVVRGQNCAAFVAQFLPTWTADDIHIRGNTFDVQNRYPGGASLGVMFNTRGNNRIDISANRFTKSALLGLGQDTRYGVQVQALVDSTILDNRFANDTVPAFYNLVTGTRVRVNNNRSDDGRVPSSLGDRAT